MKLQVEYNIWNALRCECHKCESYPGVIKELRGQHMPGVYCARGVSRLGIVKKGCHCPNCRIYRGHGLEGEYYCVPGKTKLLYPDKKERIVIAHEEKAPITAVSDRSTQGR